jgi:hypothetical protein
MLANKVVMGVGYFTIITVTAAVLASALFPGRVSLQGETGASTLVALCVLVYCVTLAIIGMRYFAEQTGIHGATSQLLNFIRFFLLYITLPAITLLAILLTGAVFLNALS